MKQPRRAFCVVYTKRKKVGYEVVDTHTPYFNETGDPIDTDGSEFFEVNEEQKARDRFKAILEEDDTYCASFCKVLDDSEDTIDSIILIPKKYNWSRLRDVVIKSLTVYESGMFIVEAENGDKKEFWVKEKLPLDLESLNADSLLCDIQDDTDINVSKY